MALTTGRLTLVLATMMALAGCADRLQSARTQPTVRVQAPAVPAERREAPGIRLLGTAAPTPAPRAFAIQPSAATSPAPPTGPSAADVPWITLNLVEAPIRQLAEQVLKDILKINYVIEGNVDGVVTLQSSEPLTARQTLELLERALAQQGVVMVEGDGVLRLVPAADGIARAAPTTLGGLADQVGYQNRVLTLRHVAPTQMAAVLEPILPSGAVVSADDAAGRLVVAGVRAELREVEELIQTFDVPPLSGMQMVSFPVRASDVVGLAADLERIVAAEGGARGTRVVPLVRTGAVLVLAPDRPSLRLAGDLLAYLDGGAAAGRSRLFYYPAENRPAAELAAVLAQAFGGAGADSDRAAPPDDDARTTAVAAAGPGAPGEGSGQGRTPEFFVTSDDASNVLVFRAPEPLVPEVRELLFALDQSPDQVLLEVTIAEVSLTDELRFGIEWFFQQGDFQGQFSGDPFGFIGAASPGLSLLLSGTDGQLVLNALAAVTDVTVVSSPSLVVLENREATLNVGDQVPIVTQQAQSVLDPDAPIVNSIEYRDTGVTLRVAPQIGANGIVILEIEQDVSDVVPTTTSGIDSPTIQQRRVSTVVSVPDGESLVLGGLIRDSSSATERGIPLLKDIPVAGALFRTTVDTQERTELLVLITPRIVRDTRQVRRIFDELEERLRLITTEEVRS